MTEKEKKLINVTNIFSLALVLIFLALQFGIHFNIVQLFTKMFYDMGIKSLPVLTLFLLNFNFLFQIILVLITIFLIGKEFIIKVKIQTFTINVIYSIFSLLHLTFVVIALFLPMINMMSNINE